MRVFLLVLKGLGALALWLLTSTIVCAGFALALWTVLKTQAAPYDPSLGDSLAWGVIFGAPVFVPLSLTLGIPLAAILFFQSRRLIARRKAKPSRTRPEDADAT